ncbi:hypothetical protein Tco_0417918 [Tanacetum coccineum]
MRMMRRRMVLLTIPWTGERMEMMMTAIPLGDDADDEDEEEEEEHLAPADSVVVVPTVELVSPPEGTKPVTPPPSTDITTTRARITVLLQASISLPPEAEVRYFLAMPTPPPSPPISLSPPSVEEHLARCTALSAHLSPPHVPSPLLPSSRCPTQIQTLRIASTQAFVDAVTAALASPPLPPSLYIPPPVDCRDDIPESERPPIQEVLFCLSRPQETWVDRAEAVPKIAHMTLGEVNTWVIELAELHEHDTQDLYALLKDAQYRDSTDCGGAAYASPEALASFGGLRRIMAPMTRRGPNTPPNNTKPNNMTPESVQAMIDQALLQNSTNGDGSHSSHKDNRRNVQTTCPCFYADFMKYQPLNFKGNKGVVGLTRWIEKMESVFNISGVLLKNQVKFATCTLVGVALLDL